MPGHGRSPLSISGDRRQGLNETGMRIGIDVGGTFTDVVLVDDATGQIHYAKTSTTPGNLADGVLADIGKALGIAGKSIEDLAYVVHGTTIGTNALIERTGAKTGLITTEGFVDVLEIGRCQRPREGMYDLSVDMPPRWSRATSAGR